MSHGSRGSWIIKYDPLSALIPAARRSGVFRVVGERQRQRDDRVRATCRPHLRPNVQEYRRQRRHFEQSADATFDVTAGRRRWYLVPAQLHQVQLSTVLRRFCESFFGDTIATALKPFRIAISALAFPAIQLQTFVRAWRKVIAAYRRL